jgi:hypothetical protein
MSTPKHTKAGCVAIQKLEALVKNHEFYLSSASEEGPIARRVKVLAVDGAVAIVDTYNFADMAWAQAPVAVDLTRTRYVGPASPMTIHVTEEPETKTEVAALTPIDNGGAN